jgi:hypothetical protein
MVLWTPDSGRVAKIKDLQPDKEQENKIDKDYRRQF